MIFYFNLSRALSRLDEPSLLWLKLLSLCLKKACLVLMQCNRFMLLMLHYAILMYILFIAMALQFLLGFFSNIKSNFYRGHAMLNIPMDLPNANGREKAIATDLLSMHALHRNLNEIRRYGIFEARFSSFGPYVKRNRPSV